MNKENAQGLKSLVCLLMFIIFQKVIDMFIYPCTVKCLLNKVAAKLKVSDYNSTKFSQFDINNYYYVYLIYRLYTVK